MTDASEMTVFEVVARCGMIVFADEDIGVLYTWNGSLTFQALQHAGGGRFYAADAWTVESAPRSLDDAIERCRQHPTLVRADLEG